MSGLKDHQKIEHRAISAPRVGKFNVYVQGDVKTRSFTVLTIHDLGCNHHMWTDFLGDHSMKDLAGRAAFIHVDIPGQEDDADPLPPDYNFPSMQSLGEDMVCVLDQLDVKEVVCIGEGAGANIAARFAITHPKRVLGVCLIHCTGSTAGFMESAKEKIATWKLDHIGMNPKAETYLVLHRFGSSKNLVDRYNESEGRVESTHDLSLRKHVSEFFRTLTASSSTKLPAGDACQEQDDKSFEKAGNPDELNQVIHSFQENLRAKINPKNLKRFVESFQRRTDLIHEVPKLKCHVLMLTGSNASFNNNVQHLYNHMVKELDKKNIEMVTVQGIANVVAEKPEKLAETFLFFLQGIGLGGGVPMPRMHRASSTETPPPPRARSMSMEEADQPRGIYSTSPSKTSDLQA